MYTDAQYVKFITKPLFQPGNLVLDSISSERLALIKSKHPTKIPKKSLPKRKKDELKTEREELDWPKRIPKPPKVFREHTSSSSMSSTTSTMVQRKTLMTPASKSH